MLKNREKERNKQVRSKFQEQFDGKRYHVPEDIRMSLNDLNTTRSNDKHSGATMAFICLRLNTCCLVTFPHRLHYLDNLKYPNTDPNTGTFPSIFDCRQRAK